ncbi:39bf07e7-cbf1-41e6-9b37-c7a544cd7786 [Sclerotinia trifoliorum]|uniref:39bf07e7-cbf1-41e6-9b37-c7a544cd7786 n=1 Tax=Sclerotinia trifoliorum TaxID=28548 RepID=A0A8H2VLN9_9HELO|nr:39bf07e7-cbf1-41e6-9b37-c7a544cd7786 [Sclerotinia trifoliorum]
MSSINHNISLFARTPFATVADFAKTEWLDLALGNKICDKQSDQLDWLHLEKKSVQNTPVGATLTVVQVEVNPVVTGFPLFRKLATELQDKIWVMVSLNYPRIITIVEENVDVVLHPDDNEYTVVGARRPKFLNTSKGALSAMVGVYRPMFELNPAKYHGEKKGVFVNPDIDCIDFASLLSLNGQLPPLDFIGALRFRGEFSSIRHVCLPAQEFHDNFQTVARIVQNLPLLESVVVEANYIDHTVNNILYMHFMIQDVHYTRPNRYPRSDMTIMVMDGGSPLVGAPAIGILFNKISDTTHRAGILETLGRVETMMRQEPNFPNRVLGAFNYHNFP